MLPLLTLFSFTHFVVVYSNYLFENRLSLYIRLFEFGHVHVFIVGKSERWPFGDLLSESASMNKKKLADASNASENRKC